MPRYVVRHHIPVWTTYEFEVEAESPEHVRERFDEMVSDAQNEDIYIEVGSGDPVENVSDEVEVFDWEGYSGYAPKPKLLLSFKTEEP